MAKIVQLSVVFEKLSFFESAILNFFCQIMITLISRKIRGAIELWNTLYQKCKSCITTSIYQDLSGYFSGLRKILFYSTRKCSCVVLCLQLLTIQQNNSGHGSSHTIMITSVMEFKAQQYRIRRHSNSIFFDKLCTAIEIVFQIHGRRLLFLLNKYIVGKQYFKRLHWILCTNGRTFHSQNSSPSKILSFNCLLLELLKD